MVATFVPVQKTKDELRKEFWDATEGIDHATVERVMCGLPVNQEIEHSEKIRTLRQVWSRYHERIQHGA